MRPSIGINSSEHRQWKTGVSHVPRALESEAPTELVYSPLDTSLHVGGEIGQSVCGAYLRTHGLSEPELERVPLPDA